MVRPSAVHPGFNTEVFWQPHPEVREPRASKKTKPKLILGIERSFPVSILNPLTKAVG